MWTPMIGQNAGMVWKMLESKGPMNITTLKKASKLDDKHLYLALGWLAREDKVRFDQVKRAVMISLR